MRLPLPPLCVTSAGCARLCKGIHLLYMIRKLVVAFGQNGKIKLIPPGRDMAAGMVEETGRLAFCPSHLMLDCAQPIGKWLQSASGQDVDFVSIEAFNRSNLCFAVAGTGTGQDARGEDGQIFVTAGHHQHHALCRCQRCCTLPPPPPQSLDSLCAHVHLGPQVQLLSWDWHSLLLTYSVGPESFRQELPIAFATEG